jgi:hypothetical protein
VEREVAILTFCRQAQPGTPNPVYVPFEGQLWPLAPTLVEVDSEPKILVDVLRLAEAHAKIVLR